VLPGSQTISWVTGFRVNRLNRFWRGVEDFGGCLWCVINGEALQPWDIPR
jgi:hypothetical protein